MMATRRGNNEGGIRLRDDGRWEARVFLGYGTDGRPDRKSIYGKTRQEVSQKMIRVQREAQQGIAPTDDRVTITQYLTRWLETVQEKSEEATYVSYKSTVDLYITPIIGKVKLEDGQNRNIWSVGQWQGNDFFGVAPVNKQGAKAAIAKPAWQ